MSCVLQRQNNKTQEINLRLNFAAQYKESIFHKLIANYWFSTPFSEFAAQKQSKR